MQTDLKVNVFKLKSGELLVANVTLEYDTCFNIEYPASILPMNDRVALIPFIPAFIEDLEMLMKHLVIDKSTIMWESLANKQMVNMYADFMLKVQSSFSGIQLVGSIPRDMKIKV